MLESSGGPTGGLDSAWSYNVRKLAIWTFEKWIGGLNTSEIWNQELKMAGPCALTKIFEIGLKWAGTKLYLSQTGPGPRPNGLRTQAQWAKTDPGPGPMGQTDPGPLVQMGPRPASNGS